MKLNLQLESCVGQVIHHNEHFVAFIGMFGFRFSFLAKAMIMWRLKTGTDLKAVFVVMLRTLKHLQNESSLSINNLFYSQLTSLPFHIQTY